MATSLSNPDHPPDSESPQNELKALWYSDASKGGIYPPPQQQCNQHGLAPLGPAVSRIAEVMGKTRGSDGKWA